MGHWVYQTSMMSQDQHWWNKSRTKIQGWLRSLWQMRSRYSFVFVTTGILVAKLKTVCILPASPWQSNADSLFFCRIRKHSKKILPFSSFLFILSQKKWAKRTMLQQGKENLLFIVAAGCEQCTTRTAGSPAATPRLYDASASFYSAWIYIHFDAIIAAYRHSTT